MDTTTTVPREPKRVTTGPDSGSASSAPRDGASSSRPSCDASSSSRSLTCGMREAQVANPQPLTKKTA